VKQASVPDIEVCANGRGICSAYSVSAIVSAYKA
jgi:hypothetical protein